MELKSAQKLGVSLLEGVLYHIYCLGSELCIRQEDQPNDDPAVVASMPSSLDMRQLWYVLREADRFHIVNAYSSLAMTEKHGIIYLKPPKKKSKQLFKFAKPWSQDQRGVVIRKDNAQTRSICLYGALLYRQIDANTENHIFRFEPMKQNVVFERSTTLVNAHTQKVLDVPNMTKKAGETLIQRSKAQFANLNQHWMFNQFRATPGGYFIQNLYSRLVIDCKKSPKVRHSDFEFYSYQLWYLERIGDIQFKIHAMDDRTKVVGIKASSADEQAEIALVGQDDPSGSWYFHGHIPLEFQPERVEEKIIVKKSVVEPTVSQIRPTSVIRTSTVPIPPPIPMTASSVMNPGSVIRRASEFYPERPPLSPSQAVIPVNLRNSLLNKSIRPSQAYFQTRTNFVPSMPIQGIHRNPSIEVVKMPVQVSEIKMQRVQPSPPPPPPMLMSKVSNPSSIPCLTIPTTLAPPVYAPTVITGPKRLTKEDIPDLKIITPGQQQKRVV